MIYIKRIPSLVSIILINFVPKEKYLLLSFCFAGMKRLIYNCEEKELHKEHICNLT